MKRKKVQRVWVIEHEYAVGGWRPFGYGAVGCSDKTDAAARLSTLLDGRPSPVFRIRPYVREERSK